MKNILSLFVALLLVASSCNTQKAASAHATVQSACPENIACNLEVLPNKSMIIKQDGIGATYYELEDHAGKTVYHYSYNLKTDKQYEDAGYREEIIFELLDSDTDLTVSDQKLQDVKLVFGVWCYCKGKAGNYKITKGNFSKKDKEISIDFPAVVADQKVTGIKIGL